MVYLFHRDVVGAKVNSIGAAGDRNIHARVDEQSRSLRLRILRGAFANCCHSSASQRFQFSAAEIFFAQLDEINSGSSSLCNLSKQGAPACRLIPWELSPIRDVVEKQWLTSALLHNLCSHLESTSTDSISAARNPL